MHTKIQGANAEGAIVNLIWKTIYGGAVLVMLLICEFVLDVDDVIW